MLVCEGIERVAAICDVAVCVVFVIKCETDEFLFAWGEMIEPMRPLCLGNDRRLSVLLLFVMLQCVLYL